MIRKQGLRGNRLETRALSDKEAYVCTAPHIFWCPLVSQLPRVVLEFQKLRNTEFLTPPLSPIYSDNNLLCRITQVLLPEHPT